MLITAVGFASSSSTARSMRLARDFRFVALHIDDDVDIGQLAGDLGDAVGAAGGGRGWSFRPGRRSERTTRGDFFAWSVATQNAGRTRCLLGGFVGVLDERLAGFGEEHFASGAWRRAGRG